MQESVFRLREWCEEDLEPFADMNADEEVMRYFPSVLTREQSDAMARRIQSLFEENGFGFWAVECEGRFAGFTGLNRTTFATPMGPHIEIGWRLAPWVWGRGIATKAATEALRRAAEEYSLSDVYSFTTQTNSRSEAVMKRLGMSRREDLDFDHPNTPGWWGQRHIVYHISI